MENWRAKVVATLATTPEQWRPLGDVFRLVADEIPMHQALRRAASLARVHRRRIGDDTTVEADDLDLVKAQWLHFTAFVLPMVDRQFAKKRANRQDLVRLKSHGPCACCAGPTYQTDHPARGARPNYACPRCARAKLVIENAAPPPAPLPTPAPRPTLRLIPVVRSQPAKTPPPPPPPPRVKRTFADLALFSSVEEIWDEFAFHATEGKLLFPRFDQNRKLRFMLHRALEAGAAQEFKRMSLFRASELRLLEFPSLKSMDAVIYPRASDWLEHKTPTLTKVEREAWGLVLCEAYRAGSITIVAITIGDRLAAIWDEMDALVAKLEPAPQRPRAPPRQRWRNAFKKITRFRVH
jgi:hypothetical protein